MTLLSRTVAVVPFAGAAIPGMSSESEVAASGTNEGEVSRVTMCPSGTMEGD